MNIKSARKRENYLKKGKEMHKEKAIKGYFNKRYEISYVDRTHNFSERIVDFIVYYINMFYADSKTMTLMDYGGGDGRYSLLFSKYFGRVLCIDLSEKGIEIARKRAEEENIKNIEFRVDNILRYNEIETDVVWISGILAYLSEADIYKLLKFMENSPRVKYIIIKEPLSKNKEEEFYLKEFNYSMRYKSIKEILGILQKTGLTIDLIMENKFFLQYKEKSSRPDSKEYIICMSNKDRL